MTTRTALRILWCLAVLAIIAASLDAIGFGVWR